LEWDSGVVLISRSHQIVKRVDAFAVFEKSLHYIVVNPYAQPKPPLLVAALTKTLSRLRELIGCASGVASYMSFPG
jgi:hypothetical protein